MAPPLSPHRRSRTWPLLVVLAVLAAACGGSDDPGPAAAAPANEASDAFPVTVEHAFGSTTVAREPERVVTIGFTDHDTVLALGVTPVAIRSWYGDYEFVWPWAEDELGDATPELLPSSDLNFEQIAALEPDLILGLYVGLEQAEYDTLSEIAPTIAQSGDHPNFGTPWQEMTLTAGTALGRVDEAGEAIAGVERLFDEVRAEHPEFEGVELAYAGVYDGDKHYVETEGSTRVRHFLDLGFVVPPDLAALGADTFYHPLSAEQLPLLDQQVVLWEFSDPSFEAAVEDNAIYQNLAVAKEGRDVAIDDPVIAGAMAHSTVLSLPVLLDDLVPKLAAAVAKLG